MWKLTTRGEIMKLLKLVAIFLIMSVASYSKIEVKVFKHLTFQEINSTDMREAVIGKGVLQIEAEEEDYGKVVEFVFVEKGVMTNGKTPIQVEKFNLADEKDKKIVIDRKTKQVEFYAVVDKRKIGRRAIDAKILEGKYVGVMPIAVNIYAPEIKKGE